MLIDEIRDKGFSLVNGFIGGPESNSRSTNEYGLVEGEHTTVSDHRDLFSDSQHFFIENIAEYLRISFERGEFLNVLDIPNVRPQFNKMWFEYSAKHLFFGDENRPNKIGALLVSLEDEKNKSIAIKCLAYVWPF